MSRNDVKRWTGTTQHVKKMSDYIATEEPARKSLSVLVNTTFVIDEVRRDTMEEFGEFMILAVGGQEYFTFSWVLIKQMMDYLKNDTLPVEVTLQKRMSKRTSHTYYTFV